MKSKIYLLSCLCLLSATLAFAQQVKLTGKVVDEKDEPIIGATINEVGNERNASSTDQGGNFRLSLSTGSASIAIKFIGYITKNINISTQRQFLIKLEPDIKGLDQVEIVAYGTQRKITQTGSISSIKGEEIRAVPTPNIQNTLAGRLPGFVSMQRSGQPGSTAAEFYIRGVNSLSTGASQQPLIIVDDIEYKYDQVQQLDANEIESITILKDASTTSIYGIKGANGVLVITTRRGKSGVPQINFTAESGVNRIIRMPKYLDSYQTALLRNEATINDSYGLPTPLPLPFSQEDLNLFRNGQDPYGHPNVNWVDVLLKRSTTQNRYNMDATGGNNIVKYFTSLGYYTQNGNLKEFTPTMPNDDANPNYFYRRTNFRSNLDISPTKTTKLGFDLNGRFEVTNTPAGLVDGPGLFFDLAAYRIMAPYAMPLTNPDGTYGYSAHPGGNNYPNPLNRFANGGYRRTFANNFNFVVRLEQKLDFITSGLRVRSNISYTGNNTEYRNLRRDVNTLPQYLYNSVTGSYAIKPGVTGRFPVYLQESGNTAFTGNTNVTGMIDYNRRFGAHSVTALVVFNQRSEVAGANIPLNYRGTTLRLGYDYKSKYIIDFTIARNGNDLFRAEERYGIFPAGALAWNLGEEIFFKKAFPVFDVFKLSGSFGLVGSDATYPSAINAVVPFNTSTNVYGFGQTGYITVPGVSEGALVNPFVTWERESKTNLRLDMTLFKGKLSAIGEYFYNYHWDQLIAQGDVPLLLGQSGGNLPRRNVGVTSNSGFEASITFKHSVKNVDFNINANVSYSKNKIIEISEAPNYPYQARRGTQIGSVLTYKNIGFFQPDDFDATGKLKPGVPTIRGPVIQPGDLKYQDMNGDGVIDDGDMAYVTRPNVPTLTYGLNLGASYRGFSLQALVQGSGGYDVEINAEGADAFNSNLRPWHLNRWTPQTAATATYPRIGLNTNINNISWQTKSNFWFTNAAYIRFRSLELSYQLPQKFINKLKILRSVRIYGAGYNLLTISKMGQFEFDPEISSGQGQNYPNTSNFNLGLQVGF